VARENRDYFGRTGFVGKVDIPSEPSPGKEVGLAGALSLLFGIVLEGVFGKEEVGLGVGTAGIS
jgi:hypothetical protein